MRIMTTTSRLFGVVAIATTLGLGGCGDGELFEVQNPGRILDEDLNSVQGVNALVTGMSADLSEGYDGNAFMQARLGDEMAGSGSYFLTGRLRRGIIDSEDADGFWGDVQRARWVAEGGLERMKGIEGYQFEGNELTAQAYLYAGLANRTFGETFCEVSFSQPYESDDGTLQPRSAAFERAVPHLQAAISNGQAAGDNTTVIAARGALASVQAWLGNWDAAMAQSNQVPTDFVFTAVYSNNSAPEENEIFQETHQRFEMSAFGSLSGAVGGPGGDPRVPWTDCSTSSDCASGNGADGQTTHYRQEKYPDLGGDIPLVKGTEMRLLEAEYALTQGDLDGAMDKINEARAHYGLDPLTSNGQIGEITGDRDSMNGWDILDRERHLTNWLEGRRLWDLHRWDHPFLDGGSVVYEPEGSRRSSCVPVSLNECQTNPNIDPSACFRD